ncbi:MAG: DUF5597 domain-containing protein [Muribaculaceae bacterium]|nr:DUF5597 domain-containing protein [Muribaculaceae bacterium]
MKQFIVIFLALAATFSCGAASRLNRAGAVPQLEVDGAPFIILGGELGNSSASCAADVDSIFPGLAAMNLNTVLVPATWELIEPVEGEFDFTSIDDVLRAARANGLRVVFLWFGAWKNSMSCYAPAWFKADTERFPRARTAAGKPLEIASAFSPEVLAADRRAFGELMRHIARTDTAGTVVMMQVENEIGMLEDARDHSALADAEYAKGVPAGLIKHLKQNRNALHPELAARWAGHGNKTSGTWAEVFGDDLYSDEYFMAWNYARYVEQLARDARAISDMPLYVNAALNSRGRRPGEYPSAGPLAHLKDIWHAAAPTVDFLSPDIYDSGFTDWVAQYALPDNVLFIPEVRRENANGAQAYYVTGRHDAIGISPFSIENGSVATLPSLVSAYATISQATPVITRYRGTDAMDGVLLTPENPSVEIVDGDTRITLSHFFTLPWDPRATDGSRWPDKGAILIRLAPHDYLLIGSGTVAKFEHVAESASAPAASLGEDGFLNSGADRTEAAAKWGDRPRIGLASVEEVAVEPDGTLRRIRTLNGDETHQGRHARIGVDDDKILHIKTYQYK